MPFYSEETIQEANRDEWLLTSEYASLTLLYSELQLNTSEAKEYRSAGFLLRIKLLRSCIDNIFNVCPLDRDELLSPDELDNVTINVQAFIFNLYGCIDNLLWVWALEKNFEYRTLSEINIHNKALLNTFSESFRLYCASNEMKKWLKYLKEYRHALAHRIPIRIPRGRLNVQETQRYEELDFLIAEAFQNRQINQIERLQEEQSRLGRLFPVFYHSENSSLVVLHGQLLSDWKTIIEFATKFLDEFHLNQGA